MTHPLDRAPWHALSQDHRRLAIGTDLALRYPSDLLPFAASGDDSPQALKALSNLLKPGQGLMYLQADPVILPPDLKLVSRDEALLMMAPPGPAPVNLSLKDIKPLGPEHLEQMLELADLTRPGPISNRAQEIGQFWGRFDHGQLVAMAGTRMRFSGFTEVSGVCTRPSHRGLGLARHLTAHVTQIIHRTGASAFLHAFKTNPEAISLYQGLGFQPFRTVHVVTAQKPE